MSGQCANDFFRDHPEVVAGLVRGIFDGIDLVRKDPAAAARLLSQAFSLPVEDCQNMIGKDGGITPGMRTSQITARTRTSSSTR